MIESGSKKYEPDEISAPVAHSLTSGRTVCTLHETLMYENVYYHAMLR